jgi:hypothetical protein
VIITFYRPDGRKERRPSGYTGQNCHTATAPYEKRELGLTKTPTADADRVPEVEVSNQERIGQ